MADFPLLARAPIINRGQEIVGYDLRLEDHGETAPSGQSILPLLGTAGQDSLFERLAKRFALLDAGQVDNAKLNTLPANRVVVGLTPASQSNGALVSRAKMFKAAGYGVCLELPYADSIAPEALELASYFTLASAELNGELMKTCNRLRKHPAKQIAIGVDTPQRFEAAHRAGCDLFRGYSFTVPSEAHSQAVNSSYTTIVALMKLAQENAPIGRIEEALKRDAGLSFKLLRYINSAGFGLSCEIQSFRHAVAVLGYQNLYRWLALLMVTAARQSANSALVIAAITRGRLAELIGETLFDSQERDNLFIVGAFSLLDAILRVPLDTIAEQITLPEAVLDALFRREGAYGPILSIVEATESFDSPESRAKALDVSGLLGLTPSQLNRAQIESVVWAENLGG